MKIFGFLLLLGIGILAWKVLRAKPEPPPLDMLIEEDGQVMLGDDWDGMA